MLAHHKDFDGWNKRKKKIDRSHRCIYFKEREIWWCSIGINIGHEQDGAGRTSQRPILILKKWSEDTCLILPLTSSDSSHHYRIPVGSIRGVESYAMISQARTIDARRLTEKMITLEAERFEYTRKTVRGYL